MAQSQQEFIWSLYEVHFVSLICWFFFSKKWEDTPFLLLWWKAATPLHQLSFRVTVHTLLKTGQGERELFMVKFYVLILEVALSSLSTYCWLQFFQQQVPVNLLWTSGLRWLEDFLCVLFHLRLSVAVAQHRHRGSCSFHAQALQWYIDLACSCLLRLWWMLPAAGSVFIQVCVPSSWERYHLLSVSGTLLCDSKLFSISGGFKKIIPCHSLCRANFYFVLGRIQGPGGFCGSSLDANFFLHLPFL